MDFIFKGFTKAVFSTDAGLNIIPSDLGEDMITAAFDSDVVKRIKTATGTIPSPEIFTDVTITLNILKTSPQYATLKSRIESNALIEGQVQFFDDSNNEWTFTKLSLKPMGFTASGNDAVVQFAIQGNYLVNQNLVAQLVG